MAVRNTRRRAASAGTGGLYGDGNSPGYVSQGYSPVCKITVVVSTARIVVRATTEESNGTGASYLHRDNVCASHLKKKPRS